MLVIHRLRNKGRASSDDRGAALVAVLIVMVVGVIVAVIVAGAVLFVIQSNASNKSSTQAFVAAESGRDAMLSAIVANHCTLSIPDATSSPFYYSVSATVGPDESHLTDACLSADKNATIKIVASGRGADGSHTTIESVYNRPVTIPPSPGGTMSYFDGSFLATQSNYTGDLVIRSGPYACNSHSTINGDLWVPNGTVDLSADCTINGSVYALGDITATGGNGATVKGNLITAGNVNLSANSFALGTASDPTTGNVYADGTFTLGNKPTILGAYVTGRAATLGKAVGRPAVSVQNCATTPAPAANASLCGTPVATPGTDRTIPSLATVTTMTQWRNLGTVRAAWGSNVQWQVGPCGGQDVSGMLAAAPTAPNTRLGIDYSACTGAVTVRIAATALSNDAVFLVPPGSRMTVNVTGSLTSGAAPDLSNAPQLFFVHADGNLNDTAPTCVSGSASDALSLPATVQARLMFYTPCGLNNSSQNGLVFKGQFYANNDGSAHWVHPDFTCTTMSWSPVIDLGCKVAASVADPGPTSTIVLPPSLNTQREI